MNCDLTSGGVSTAVEEVCGELYAELRAEVIADSGSYIQYLEANEEEKE